MVDQMNILLNLWYIVGIFYKPPR